MLANNINILKFSLIGLLCVLFATMASAARSPQDYAYGANLAIPGNEPFYRLPLNHDIYTQTAWPDLRDIQVFNRLGQPVPMALHAIASQQKTVTPIALRVFPTQSKREERTDSSTAYTIIAGERIEINIDRLTKDQQVITYLLQLPEQAGSDYSETPYFRLNWANADNNWQAKASLYESEDLRSWQTIADEVPIMDLHSGEERLLLNEIKVDYRHNNDRHWLLVISAEPGVIVPAIKGAEIIYENRLSTQERVNLNFTLKSATADEAVYTLPTPQPLSSLEVDLQQANTVMPLQISYMGAEPATMKPHWLPLQKLIAYQLDSYTATTVNLDNKTLVKAIRLQAINSSWGKAVPILRGQRGTVEVIFNSGNNGPFILAWGSKPAQHTTLSVEDLIPAKLRTEGLINRLPVASIEAAITLSGAQKLSAEMAEPQTRSTLRWALWVALILGALVVGFIAYKLGRELLAEN